MSDLKAERERLDSLSKEKSHADKLNKRVSDMNANISAKEIEYEEIKKEYDQLVLANQRFYDQATKFREMYVKLEGLQERKLRYQEDLDSAKENLQAVEGRHKIYALLLGLTKPFRKRPRNPRAA